MFLDKWPKMQSLDLTYIRIKEDIRAGHLCLVFIWN